MKRILGLTLALSTLLLIPLGCGGNPSAVGKWSLDTEAMKKIVLEERTAGLSEDNKKEIENNPMVKSILDMYDKMTMEMDLKADGTCSSTATLKERADSTTGTWKMEGDILTVTMKTMMDENPAVESLKLKVKGDTMQMILDEEKKKAGTPAFIFIRI